jgi:GNAT superfamily N-acetyltransferase
MALPVGFSLRQASTADLDVLVEHRRAMFEEIGHRDSVALDHMALKFRRWLLEHMNAGDYLAWLLISPDGSIATGAGLWLMDWPSHMVGRSDRRGNVLNVYTAPQFRRRGLARTVMDAVLQWCRDNGVDTVILHASPAGRKLYEEMGFRPTNEMRIVLQG